MGLRVQILSDLHFEFHRDGGRSFVESLDPDGVDVLILAGDIAVGEGIQDALLRLCGRYPSAIVLFVPGNHEYYRSSPPTVAEILARLESTVSNLRVLVNRVVQVGGIRFGGTSLWFREDPGNAEYAFLLSDFRVIRDFVPWVYEQNREAEAFIRREMGSETPPDVLITHHLPSERCVAPIYKGGPLNRFFVAPLGDELARLPSFWVYGHTHTPMDEVHEGCRFVCNPLGYPDEAVHGFRKKLVFETSQD